MECVCPRRPSRAPPQCAPPQPSPNKTDGADDGGAGKGNQRPSPKRSCGNSPRPMRWASPDGESLKTLPLPEIPGQKAGGESFRPPKELIQLMAGKATLDNIPSIPGSICCRCPKSRRAPTRQRSSAPSAVPTPRSGSTSTATRPIPGRSTIPNDPADSDLTQIDHTNGFWLEATSASTCRPTARCRPRPPSSSARAGTSSATRRPRPATSPTRCTPSKASTSESSATTPPTPTIRGRSTASACRSGATICR